MIPDKFKAYRLYTRDGCSSGQFDYINLSDLTPGDVVVKVAYSSVNYKDALAATGKGSILKSSPLVAGIDLSGTVISSKVATFEVGDRVIAAGHTLSERIDGGYTEYARLPEDALTRLPNNLSLKDAITIGTAGLTAAAAVIRMEDNGLAPGNGPIAITGSTGGVGSFAIDILSARGYDVVALTRQKTSFSYLRELGARSVETLGEQIIGGKELNHARFGGAIDNLGGNILEWLISSTKPLGCVACVGLVVDARFSATVLPFILRSVSLLGINSYLTPRILKCDPWARLVTDLRPRKLSLIANRVVDFDELPSIFEEYIDGRNIGRTIVRIDPDI